MSTPLELSCEQLAQLLLRTSAGVTGVIPINRIFTQSEDAAADPSNKDRLVCKASPRKPDTYGLSTTIVLVWSVMVEVCLYFTGSVSQLQPLIAAIEAAMIATPNAAGFVIINASGIRRMDQTEEGDFSTEDNARKRSRTYNYLCEI
jgi:hypothetical protein